MPLHQFVPNTLRRLLAGTDRDTAAPYADELELALLFADISGFTALMEHHVQRGPSGLEALTQTLNGYFGRIIELVTQRGGDVVSFAGDALLVVWHAADHPDGLAGACLRASQCALAVQQLEPDVKERVSMRVAVCAGRARLLRLGGERTQRCAFLVGEPLSQLAATLKLAQPGDVAVSPQARATMAAKLAVGLGESMKGRVLRPGMLGDDDGRAPEIAATTDDDPAVLHRYIPPAIRQVVESPAARPVWIAQFRQISGMFVRLPAPDPARDGWLAEYHQLVLELQRAVFKFGGRIDKLTSEEKGILLLAVWGVPGATHEDDPLRAVQAAVHVRELLQQRGHPVAIGVATGRAYCGLVGSEVRSEYTIVGRVVNLAARLMQQATGVLCDELTRGASEDRVEFLDGRALTIRGIRAKVVASEPVLVRSTSLRRRHPETSLVARGEELAALRACVDELVTEHRGRSVIVAGKAGIGKSRLLEELRRVAMQRGAIVFEAVGDAVEADAPYVAVRPVVAGLLGLGERAWASDASGRGATVSPSLTSSSSGALNLAGLRRGGELLLDDPELAERAPLLEAILPCGLGDNEFTRALAGDARAASLHALVATLLRRRASEHPVVVLLDDAHWFDSASLALVRALTRTVAGVLFAFAWRPQQRDAPAELEELRREERAVVLELEGLDDPGMVAMLSRCLKVEPEQVPQPLLTMIRERTDGNPLFIEQLALSLVEAGHVVVQDGTCRVETESGALTEVSLPGTIHGILNSRLDQLPSDQQFFLRIASVLGRSFDLRIVGSLYPQALEGRAPPELGEVVDALEAQGIISRRDRSDTLCGFRHPTTVEAVYDSLLFAYRREMHRAVARWYEDHSKDPSEHLALLAHHWSRAEDHPKARFFLELAGARALERSANAEAARLFEQLLALVAAERVTPDRDRAALWREQLCEAHYRTSNLRASLRHGLAALELLAAPMPRSTLGMFAALLRMIAERNFAGLPRRFPRDVTPEERARRVRALKVQHRLTDVYGYLSNMFGFLLSSCRELALAEACDEHGEAACANLMLYFIVSVTPLRSTAEPWIDRALRLIEREGDRALAATALGRVAVAHMQGGDFTAAARVVAESRALADAAGDLRVVSEVYAFIGLCAMHRGLFATAERAFAEVASSSDFSGDEQFAVWAAIGRAGCLEAQGRGDEAFKLLARAAPWLEAKALPTTYIWGQGVHALVALRVGQRELAARLVERVLARLRREKVLAAYWLLGGIESLCVAAQGLLAGAAAHERRAAAKTVRECHKFLALFARTLPFAAASAAYQEAALAGANGQREQELVALRRCVEAASGIDAMHLLTRAYARLGELAASPEEAMRARMKAEEAIRRRAEAEQASAAADAARGAAARVAGGR